MNANRCEKYLFAETFDLSNPYKIPEHNQIDAGNTCIMDEKCCNDEFAGAQYLTNFYGNRHHLHLGLSWS